jgi:processive 1,2-diacylglycerol beta-glucosyltransferase
MRQPDAVIISGSLGAGHDGAANELARRLAELNVHAPVIDFLDRIPSLLSSTIRSGYYASASYAPRLLETFFRSSQGLRGEPPALINVMTRIAAKRLLPDVAGARVVVSTFPFATQAVGYLRSRGMQAVTASYLTDPAAHRLWLHPAVDHHLTVTDATGPSVDSFGYKSMPVGPLVSRDFRGRLTADEQADLRAELGVAPDRTLTLLMSGSYGMGSIRHSAEAVRSAGAVPVVLCGRNDRLRRDLQARGITALGWRSDVHRLMCAADVLVHNSGGMSFTESLVVGLPSVTFMPIAGHGRLNAQVLDDAGTSPWARSVEELGSCFSQLASRKREPFAEEGETAAAFIANLCGASRGDVEE